MSEMVERVARALAECDFEAVGDYQRLARAAIQALREPTGGMLKAEGVQTNCPMCGGHVEGWKLMIDEALK